MLLLQLTTYNIPALVLELREPAWPTNCQGHGWLFCEWMEGLRGSLFLFLKYPRGLQLLQFPEPTKNCIYFGWLLWHIFSFKWTLAISEACISFPSFSYSTCLKKVVWKVDTCYRNATLLCFRMGSSHSSDSWSAQPSDFWKVNGCGCSLWFKSLGHWLYPKYSFRWVASNTYLSWTRKFC